MRRRRLLRAIAWTVAGLTVATVAAGTALVVFAPVGLIRDRLATEVKARTGRDLRIAGRTSLSFYPTLGVAMNDVSLSAPPSMGGATFVQMRRLEAQVSLLPLLSRRVSVDRLVLTDPVFDLRVDASGRRTWDFAALSTQATVMVAQAPARKPPGTVTDSGPRSPELEEFLRNSSGGDAGAGPAANAGAIGPAQPSGRGRDTLQELTLGDVRIENGSVRYRDDRSGASEEIRAIDARLTGSSLSSPVEAKGSLGLRGDRIEFDARLSTPRALMEERPVKVALAIASPRATGRYAGSLGLAKGPQLDGALKLEVPSVRDFAQWLGIPPGTLPATGPFALDADMRSGPAWVAFNNAKVRLDETKGSGSATIDFAGARPNLKANLELSALDLNPYLAARAVEPPADAPSVHAPLQRPAKAGTATPPKSGGPQVKGYTGQSGWSEEAFNLLILGALDADVRLALASLTYREIKVGSTRLVVALKNRAMRTTFEDVKLYGGTGRGTITLEPTAAGTAIGANIAVDGASALPLLKDATGFDWVEGKARLQLALAGQGAHQRAIMEGLNGKAEFAFTDGAIVGYNLPKMIQGISQGRLAGLTRSPAEKTDFSEAGASFQIRNGIAESKDIRATSPHLRMTGAGTANLGQRQVDATLRPKLGAAPAAQQPVPGAAPATPGETAGLEVPVRIRGPWERPQVSPDIDAILKNPQQAMDALRELGRQVQQGKGGNLNQLIDQFRRR